MGSPTINDGVVSNFSTSNYAVLTNNFDVSNGETWEMVFKVKTGNDFSVQQYIVGATGISGSNDPVIIGIYQEKFCAYISYVSSSTTLGITTNVTPIADTDYVIKLKFTGSEYNLYVNDVLSATLSSIIPIYAAPLAVGIQSSAGSGRYPWLGSVDFNESYIKANNKVWWTGLSTIPANVNDYDLEIDTEVYKAVVDSTIIERPWTQPVLFADGTLGGNSFAVYASDNYSSCYPYCASDGVIITSYKNGDQWITQNGVDFIFYNPIPIKVTSLDIRGGFGSTYTYRAYTGDVYASNNNSEYTKIGSWSVNADATATSSIIVDLSSNQNYYKYYKLVPTAFIKSLYWGISELLITAVIKESSAIRGWIQPVLSSNGILGGNSFAVAGAGYAGCEAWRAFDSDISNDSYANMTTEEGAGSDSLIFYNPEPLRVSSITLLQCSASSSPYIKNGTVYASNDNENWTSLLTFTGTNTASYIIDLSSNTEFYNYYKITMTDSYYQLASNSQYYWYVNNCSITAVKRI